MYLNTSPTPCSHPKKIKKRYSWQEFGAESIDRFLSPTVHNLTYHYSKLISKLNNDIRIKSNENLFDLFYLDSYSFFVGSQQDNVRVIRKPISNGELLSEIKSTLGDNDKN